MPHKVLVVEDESIVALDLRNHLQRMDYSVVGVADTAEKAHRLAHDHRPDVILMDIQLRGPVDGIDAATEIQSALDIPVIFLTAYSDERSLRRAKESRAYGYILKPFQERELGITIDLALYKHAAERDVARSRQLLDVTVNSIRDGVVTTDDDGAILLFNPAAEALTGWSVADALGRDHREVIRTEAISDGTAPERWVSLISRDGGERTVAITENILEDGGSSGGSRVMVIRDVAAEREHAERLVAAKEAAESAGRARSDFLSRVTHELRTPLNSIQGMAELIRTSESLSEIRDFIGILKGSVVALDTLIADVLDYAGHESTRPGLRREPFDPVRAVEEVCRTHALDAERKELRLAVVVDTVTPRIVVGDENRFSQVVRHLVSNAVKFTLRGHVVVNVTTAGEDGLMIVVEDTGPGIPEDARAFVFEDFSQIERPARRRAGGVGLGLAIVRRLVTAMDGDISVESDAHGTRLGVVIPFPEMSRVLTVSQDDDQRAVYGSVTTDDDLVFRAWAPWCEQFRIPIGMGSGPEGTDDVTTPPLFVTVGKSAIPSGAATVGVAGVSRRWTDDCSRLVALLREPLPVDGIVAVLSGDIVPGRHGNGVSTGCDGVTEEGDSGERDRELIEAAAECLSAGDSAGVRRLLAELRATTTRPGVAETAFRTLLALRRDETMMTGRLLADLKKELSS
jgi:two-component system, cell cycle sensor histidine kinase and response regulator CckA